MKFSIVVPVYNVEPFLGDCLESILTQNYDDYEVICVNDASTDNSLVILQDFIKMNKKIRLINNSVNRGLSFSRNCGIRNASGKYILFVDSDDILCQGALKKLSEEADRYDTDIIYFNMMVKNEGQWAKEKGGPQKKHYKYEGTYTGQELFVKLYQNDQIIVEVWRQLFLKKFIDENNLYFYEGIVHEDALFSVICAMKARQVSYLEQELYIYRRRDGSIMSKLSANRMESCFIVLIELWDFWYSNTFSAEVNEALGRYLKMLFHQFRYMRCYFPEVNTISYGGPAEQFMFTMLTSDDCAHIKTSYLSSAQLKYIKTAEKVIVYGAGRVGIEVIHLLRLENIEADVVAVSNKHINPDNVLGIKIEQIDELTGLEHAVIIAAVTEKYRGEVSNKLKQLGMLDNVIFLQPKDAVL